MTRTVLGLTVLLACFASLPERASASPVERAESGLVLERVVILARHGVRSPTKGSEELSRFSQDSWPEWPVGAGELTDHGSRLARRMGLYLRRRYAAQGLLPARGCPARGLLALWADSADQRTRMSGQALAQGLAPGCGARAAHAAAGTVDPLFSANRHGGCAIDPDAAKAEILTRAGGDLDRLGPDYDRARLALQRILFPGIPPQSCDGRDEPGCFLLTAPNSLRTEGGIRLDGPLAAGATIGESILLEYAEGFPAGRVGWGRAATGRTLAEIMPLHDLYADLMRRSPYIAARHSALLARRIADLLLAPWRSGDARLITFVGHDTNLANIAGLLDVDWRLPDQPDKTAPDTALAFEVWRDGDRRYVRLAVHYQTLAELRNGTDRRKNPPLAETEPVPMAGCDGPDGLCRVQDLVDRLTARIEPACLLSAADH